MRQVVSDKGQACLVTVFHRPETPPRDLPAQVLAGRGRAGDCRLCCEGRSRDEREVKPAWPLRVNFFLFYIEFIHTVMSWTKHILSFLSIWNHFFQFVSRVFFLEP